MGRIFLTSDLHFNHNKDFIYAERGFNSVEEMNTAIIKNWNCKVTNDDEVYILGDIMLGDNTEGIDLLNQLNGYKHIIIGNHDTSTRIKMYESAKNVVQIDYAFELKYKKAYFWLSHYPTITANYDDGLPWAQHLINLFGHTHQKEKFYNDNPYMYNVGVDAHSCFPIDLDTIIEEIKMEKEKLNNEKQRNKD